VTELRSDTSFRGISVTLAFIAMMTQCGTMKWVRYQFGSRSASIAMKTLWYARLEVAISPLDLGEGITSSGLRAWCTLQRPARL
jgi:hypothetical protein